MSDDAASLKFERHTPDPEGDIVIHDGQREVMTVPRGQNMQVVLDPGRYDFQLSFAGSARRVRLPQIELEPRGRATVMLLSFRPPGFWQRLLRRGPTVETKTVIDPPRAWPTQRTQFWVGTADNADAFWAVFNERTFPEPQSDEEQWAQDDMPKSLFAELQGEIFIDHDFTEGAYVGDDGPWADRVGPHSWSPFWAEEALTRAKAAGFDAPNAFFMCGVDEPVGRTPDLQVRAPRDLEAAGVSMAYIGEIVHRTQ